MPRRSQRSSANARRSVAAHVRDRQRAVAEREASRLARPERRPAKQLGHADRKKSAVTSIPFGVLPKKQERNCDPTKENWCGPFAVAREMIAAREEARRLREEEQEEEGTPHPLDEAMKEYESEKKRKAHPSLQWKSKLQPVNNNNNNESLYSKRQKRVDTLSSARAVPSLFQICVDFLVKNFEYVEGLGDVDSSIRTSVARALVASGKMNAESFRVLAEVGAEALEIVDCSEISQATLVSALKDLIPSGLRYLLLGSRGALLGTQDCGCNRFQGQFF